MFDGKSLWLELSFYQFLLILLNSAVRQHILEHSDCAICNDDEQFLILAERRSHFCLFTLEITCIKTLIPELHHLKNVFSLKLTHL